MALDSWLAALEERHLANLTLSEVARALRALSSCYVERRGRLARGGALDTAGKRAAFALFYAPVHFLVVREIVRTLPAMPPVDRLLDLGCGTGAGSAAWALESAGVRVVGFDRHPWTVAEANWTYRQLEVSGHAAQQDIARVSLRGAPGGGILLAYAVNELTDAARGVLLPRLVAAHGHGARLLVIEPIARRSAGWWRTWEATFAAAGGTAAEWRFPIKLPPRQRALAKAAGLNPREVTARSLVLW